MIRGVATVVLASAAALAGCGAPPAAKPRPAIDGAPKLTLKLHGSTGDEQLLACSLVHHYATFPSRRQVAYDGRLTPPVHRFKLKVKIKRCVDGRFQDSGSQPVHGHNGRYTGTLQPPGKGVYYARARARVRGSRGDSLSDKFYFEVK